MDTNSNNSDFIGVSSGFLEKVAIEQPHLIVQLRDVGKFRLLGSQALHLCYVASGRMKACVNLESKIWDDIAGALILQEANGTYSTITVFYPDRVNSVDPSQSLFSLGKAEKKAKLDKIIRRQNIEE